MQRHIIVSDIHGTPSLLTNALEHSNFRQGVDKLVVAGDWCDIGSDTALAWHLIKEYADAILLGNHELAHLDRIKINPYDSELDRTELPVEWREWLRTGKIKIAHSIGNVLITHAGLSWEMADMLNMEKPSAVRAADILNEEGTIDSWSFMDMSPFWFRPLMDEYGRSDLTNVPRGGGIRQIAGHTPMHYYNDAQQKILEKLNFTLIDPYARENFDKDGYCVYAIVTEQEDGQITIERISSSKDL